MDLHREQDKFDKACGWDPVFYRRSTAYEPITPAARRLGAPQQAWPTLDQYNALIQSAFQTVGVAVDTEISVIAQEQAQQTHYEAHVFRFRQIPTRTRDWHDFFQILVWSTFPRSKLALNIHHYRAYEQRVLEGGTGRSPPENAATIFDESGAIFVSDDADLLELLRNFQWRTLFWDRREAFHSRCSCFVFGHGTFQKLLAPYIGLTSHAIPLEVPRGFFSTDLENRLHTLDTLLANELSSGSHLASPQNLAPLPLLGIPGWYPLNETPAFYENTQYFRPGRNR